MKHIVRIFVLSLFAVWARADDWTPVEREAMDSAKLSDVARAVLDAREFKWKHAQTKHFVIHYENGVFAAKVARQAEFYYDHISQDLGGLTDRMDARSHIFIFRKSTDWHAFVHKYLKANLEWSFSMVIGPIMYLQQASDISASASTLSHEMSHLVFNRFIEGRVPLWLNEGLAEWYGEFAYAAFKGVRKSKKTAFGSLRSAYPVAELVALKGYPADRNAIHTFYQTSKHLVAFMQLELPSDKFAPFLLAMARGAPVESALQEYYGLSLEELIARFDKYRR